VILGAPGTIVNGACTGPVPVLSNTVATTFSTNDVATVRDDRQLDVGARLEDRVRRHDDFERLCRGRQRQAERQRQQRRTDLGAVALDRRALHPVAPPSTRPDYGVMLIFTRAVTFVSGTRAVIVARPSGAAIPGKYRVVVVTSPSVEVRD
jgi:hypothetical protein